MQKKPDWLLRACLATVVFLYAAHALTVTALFDWNWLTELSLGVFERINTVWWGIAIGIVMISLLGRVPREFVMNTRVRHDDWTVHRLWRAAQSTRPRA